MATDSVRQSKRPLPKSSKSASSTKKTDALQASEERYQAFIRNSHEGIWRVEVEEPIPVGLSADEQIELMYRYGYMAEANQAMAVMYGVASLDDLLGARLGDLLIRDDPRNTEYLKAFIDSGYSLSGVESRELDVNGKPKVFINSLVGVVEGGLLLRAWGTQQDVTQQYEAKETLRKSEELKAANAILKRQQEQLVRLNNSKDEFISLASHQLRTPANIVKQYIGMLLEGYLGPVADEHRTFLQVAYESNERQLQIIDDLLRVAQVDAGRVVLKKTTVDLGEMLASAVREYAAAFTERQQSLLLASSPQVVLATVDAARLRMVLDNLIDNAGKYSGPSTTVTVSLQASNGEVIISIRDQGIGIARKDIGKLFQKFSRIENDLSRSVGGSGLGLYWAKKIIDLHRGAITVDSHPRQGTTFRITLPHSDHLSKS